MPHRLKRHYDPEHLHFITFSCYRRLQLLAPPRHRDALLRILEQVRRRYRFALLGYVIMPEHVHLLIGKPAIGDPSTVIKALKQQSAKRFLRRRSEPGLFPDAALDHFWQKRFYDFNVYSERKVVEKLRYMHRNPVKRRLVTEPDQWRWSSFRSYMHGETGPVAITTYERLSMISPDMKPASPPVRSPTQRKAR